MKKVVILVGASGSGKSTWAAKYAEGQGVEHTVVSADHYFVQSDGTYEFDGALLPQAHSACQKSFREALDRGCELVLVDNTGTRAWEREDYVAYAKKWGYEVWLKVFKVDPKVAAARNVHGVPLAAIEKMTSRIDVPEGFYEA